MKPTPNRILPALRAALMMAVASAPAFAGTTVSTPAVEARVDALLAKMTLEEKVGQLNQLSSGSLTGPARVVENGDSLIRSGGVGSLFNSVTAKETNGYQKAAIEGSRLHIPILFGLDVIHGFRTIFPIPLGLSASWDTALIEQTARLAAVETSSQGIRWTFSPMVDIARDSRWGRIAEGAGEDPFLGSLVAKAYVRGYQGDRLDAPSAILACAKHYVGYGAAEGGRDYNTTEISERTLRDVYLPPFHAAVEEGAGTIMSAFNSLNGVPSSANPFTLTTILRGEWGFQGFVDSDWTAVREVMLHGIADTERAAAMKSFNAGVDMDMQSDIFLPHLPGLVKSGEVPMARIDDAVRRILRIKFDLGLFDHPFVAEPPDGNPTELPSSRALATRAAEASFVLLENRPVRGSAILPLAPKPGQRIAVIGPLSDSAEDMLGSWEGQGRASDVVTLKTALSERAGRDGFKVSFAEGTDLDGLAIDLMKPAIDLARASDIVILTLGERGHDSGEASARSRLDLPGNQEALLEAVVATGKPVVLVVFSGRPLALEWASRNVPAVLMAWFPGVQAGPALVGTLFGDSDPAGRLTVSVPRYVGQVPIYYNHLNTGRPRVDPIGLGSTKADPKYVTGYIDELNTPLYPFGYGLGYTTFDYSGVTVEGQKASARALNDGAAAIKVGALVRNSGSRPGTETVQLYIRLRGTSVARPVRELKGFRKVRLAPGESQRVEFTLGRNELSFWNAQVRCEVEPSSLYVWVAPDSSSGEPAKIDITE